MTENKRFTMINHNKYDNGDCIYYDNGEEMGSLDVLDTLNELNDGKQYWKQVCHMIEDTYHELQKKFHNWDIALSKCREENEQLKQRIKELEKEVNSLSCGEADWLIEEEL